MKRKVFIFSILAVFFFYSGYYTNQKINIQLSQTSEAVLANKMNNKTSKIIVNSKYPKPNKITRLDLSVNNSLPIESKEIKPPHERAQSEEAKQEIENQFYVNQEAEVDFFETLLVSMKENNFPEAEIAEIQARMDQINSTQYVDDVSDQDKYSEEITLSKTRADFSESLYQSEDLSSEEIKKMVLHMFPDEESENNLLASRDDDTSIPPHELESQ